jgi:hypothetical protein
MLQDPDMALLVLFKPGTVENPAKSALAGRPIVDDVEICEVRIPGSRWLGVYPAHQFSRWVTDPYTGKQQPQTYAERFARQYAQFVAKTEQTKSGTPLEYIPFLTESRRAELKGLNIYTVEALAHIDGQELKNLGPGGRELKNKAEEYLEQAKHRAADTVAIADMEAMRAKLQMAEDDREALKAKLLAAVKAAENAPPASDKPSFEAMTAEQLRAYIVARTGHTPHGSINLKTLQRMAADATPTHQPELVS